MLVFADETADGLDPNTRGDEQEIISEQLDDEDSRPKIPEDFFYNSDDHISKANVTEGSGLPTNLLTLQYPCHINLYITDNLLHIYGDQVGGTEFKNIYS